MYLIDRTEALRKIEGLRQCQDSTESGLNIQYGLYIALQELGKVPKADEATCENISELDGVDGFECSECGVILEDWNCSQIDEDDGDITYHDYMFRYCPNCGRRIKY